MKIITICFLSLQQQLQGSHVRFLTVYPQTTFRLAEYLKVPKLEWLEIQKLAKGWDALHDKCLLDSVEELLEAIGAADRLWKIKLTCRGALAAKDRDLLQAVGFQIVEHTVDYETSVRPTFSEALFERNAPPSAFPPSCSLATYSLDKALKYDRAKIIGDVVDLDYDRYCHALEIR